MAACKDTRISKTSTNADPSIADPLIKVVLIAPRNPLNIGAAARAMSNFGFFDLRLVDAYDVAFQEARSAVKAAHVLRKAKQFPATAAAIADCELVVGTTSAAHRTPLQRLLRLETAAVRIKKSAGPVAILFGSEKFGLSNDDLSHCHWLMRIPTREAHHSMNLGQAVSIVLYELVRLRRVPPHKDSRHKASAESLQRFEELLLDALRRSGYGQTPSTIEKVRRLIRRLDLPPHDVEVWQGMIRQILWKLGYSENA